MVPNESCRSHGALEIGPIAEDPGCTGEPRDHQSVPCRDNFVVEMRSWTRGTQCKELCPAFLQDPARLRFAPAEMRRRLRHGLPLDQNIASSKFIVRIAARRRVA